MKDILDQMTKQELIRWMRIKCWNRLPKLSDVLFARWEIESLKYQDRIACEAAELKGIDAKLRDQLAVRHNESTDAKERMSLLKQIIAIDEQYKTYFAKSSKTEAYYGRIQKLYDQSELEREKGN